MNYLRYTLVILAGLVLSASFAIPAENMAETAYDESESLPFDCTSTFFIGQATGLSRPQSVDGASQSLGSVIGRVETRLSGLPILPQPTASSRSLVIRNRSFRL